MNSCSIESTVSESETSPKYCPNERFDFLARGGDEPDRPGEDERDLVRQGDVVVIDRGQRQGLALLADRENQVLASKTLWDEAANRARDLLTPPARGLFSGADACKSGRGDVPMSRAGSEPVSFRTPVVSR